MPVSDQPIERQTLDLTEAARILGVHPDTLRAAVEAGEFFALKLRTRYLVPRAYLERLLAGPRHERPAAALDLRDSADESSEGDGAP